MATFTPADVLTAIHNLDGVLVDGIGDGAYVNISGGGVDDSTTVTLSPADDDGDSVSFVVTVAPVDEEQV